MLNAIKGICVLLLLTGILGSMVKVAYIEWVYNPEQYATMDACKARGVSWYIDYEDEKRWYASAPWQRIRCNDDVTR